MKTTPGVARSPLEIRRPARWAGVVYVALGVAPLFAFSHASLVHGDNLDVLARAITASEPRIRVGVLSDVLATVLTVPLALLLGGRRAVLDERKTMLLRATGELPVMLWLLFKGVDPRGRDKRGADSARVSVHSRSRPASTTNRPRCDAVSTVVTWCAAPNMLTGRSC